MPRKPLSILLSLAALISGSTLLQGAQGGYMNDSFDTLVSRKLLSDSLPSLARKPAPKAGSEAGGERAQGVSTQKPNDSSTETVLRLEDLIAEALANNPEIEAAERMVDAKRAVAPQQRTLPDPMISGGWAGNIVPPFSVQTGDPSSARMLGFSQEIPFPGKLALRGRIADTEATAEQWNYERTKLAVISNLKQTYYDLFFIEKAIATVQKDKDLLEKLAQIAEARYAVGKGMQQDVIRAQVEISKLLERLTLLEQREGVAQAMLRSLLNRPPDAPIGVPADVTKTEMPYSLNEIQAIAEAHSPDLKSQEREIDKNQLALSLAKKDYYPDFGVGFTYFNRPQLPEMYSFNFTAKVPIYFWKKQRYGVEEAASTLVSSRKRTEAVKTNLFFKMKDQYLAMKASERLMDLYSKAIVPQSTLALDSSLSGYQVGNIDFLSMLSNFLTVLDYELNYYDSLTNYQKAVARLEEVIGTALSK
ncbi:MAG: TolC family protein [Acidobacteriia bacterium]|nr:TolC family protein [Terriglobia bacterium]